MRIIAGSAGGLRLEVPPRGVRPTMDRVKAAIFSSLGDKLSAARVLDLFAGAGGLGIEALSRGAASALFVEQNAGAARTIERNLTLAKTKGRVRVADVFGYLRSASERFDIIFADPPYEKTASGDSCTKLLLLNKRLPQLLATDGVFVLEKRPAEELIETPFWTVVRARKYGATEVIFLSAKRHSAPANL